MPSKVEILVIIWVGKNFVGQPHVHMLNIRGSKFSKARQSARDQGEVLVGEAVCSAEIN